MNNTDQGHVEAAEIFEFASQVPPNVTFPGVEQLLKAFSSAEQAFPKLVSRPTGPPGSGRRRLIQVLHVLIPHRRLPPMCLRPIQLPMVFALMRRSVRLAGCPALLARGSAALCGRDREFLLDRSCCASGARA